MDKLDREILLEISGDLEIAAEPFQNIAERLGVTEEIVIARLKNLQEQNYIKRIVPIIRHYKTDYKYNAMIVWQAAKKELEILVELTQNRDEISHIYERETCQEWPYNFYTMIHGTSKASIQVLVLELAAQSQVSTYKILATEQEWKKTSPDLNYLFSNV